MKLKNIIKGLFCCAILGSTTACTDLTETVYSQLPDDAIDINDEAVVESLMGEAMAQFRYIYWSWFGYNDLMEECTDLYCVPKRIGVGWGDLYVNMHKQTWNSEHGMLENNWNYNYACIGYCNKALDVLPREGYQQACMRFYRATVYYMLLDEFRNVPLDTTQIHEAGYLPEQKPASEIFDFCVSELNAIKGELGTTKHFGYPNRFAADMTLAKLYLNHDVYLGGDGKSYFQKALEEVNDIIDNGGYSLAANYSDNFKANISGSPEVIFAIPLDKTNASHNYNVNVCLQASGAAAYGYQGAPWNGSAAIEQFIDTYDADDKRLAATWTGGIQRAAIKSDSTYIPQAGDPIQFGADDWSGTGYLNYCKSVHSIDNPGAYQQEGYRYVKNEIVGGTDGTYGDDVAFYRYADALMIKAECMLRLGMDGQEAAALVTQVRKRAFDSSSKATRSAHDLQIGSVYKYGHHECTSEGYNVWNDWIDTDEGGADIELGGLLDDLAWEFMGEHHRRQDLIRFKLTDGRPVFIGKSWFCKDAVSMEQGKHLLYFPLPKSALDANISLKQNEGY